jgi:hypothetical protein
VIGGFTMRAALKNGSNEIGISTRFASSIVCLNSSAQSLLTAAPCPLGLCRLRETAEATKNMTVLFCFKLTSDVDSRLRRHLNRRGQLVTLIVLILNTIDLRSVPVLEFSSDLEDLAATTVKLPAALHANLKRIASARQSSMNALMNSAIWAYTEEKSEKQ